ncbi:MAG: helix-turn-helix domain-containing protein [Acidimicrobiales bacterium]
MGSEAVTATPAPPLRAVIKSYRGYRSFGGPPVHRGLPSGALTFIISLDDPVDIAAMPSGLQVPGKFQAFIGGMHDTPAYIRQHGFQHGLSLEMTPLGSRTLLGLPAGELANAVVSLDELVGPSARDLVDRLATARGWRERFVALDEALVRWLKTPSRSVPEVQRAWEMLVSTAGSVEVSTLADEVGYGRRHLGDLFRRELGLAPKAAARVLRFERSRRLIACPEKPNLAQVAAAAGYYDQAHMTREWTEIAGCPPSVWMAEELPFVQDEPIDSETNLDHDNNPITKRLARSALS